MDDLSLPSINPYAIAEQFVYRPRWTSSHFGVHRDLTRAMCIDSSVELRDAWQAILASGGPEANPDAMRVLEEMPTRPKRLNWQTVLSGLVLVPMILPPFVGAIGLQQILGHYGTLNVLLGIQFDWLGRAQYFGVVLLQALGLYRIMYLNAIAALANVDPAMGEAAANLAAGPATTLLRVTLPLITANLIAGALLTFSFSMLEVSDSLMLAQRQDYYPITKTIYELFRLIGTGKYIASALGVWAMVFLAVTILGSSLMLGKKHGTVFRA